MAKRIGKNVQVSINSQSSRVDSLSNGLEVLDVGCEFWDQSSIPSECQRSHDVDLGQVNFIIASVATS